MNIRSRILPLFIIVALGLTACSTSEQSETQPQISEAVAAEAASVFPVTLSLPDGEELTIEEEPQRIAALSSDVAITLHELGLTDRLVAVPEISTNSTFSSHSEELSDVPNHTAGDNTPEPEQVLSWEPDLVIVTTRHTGERNASEQLTATGVPVLSLTNGWSTTEEVLENIDLIGQATGATQEAAELEDEIREGLANVQESSSQASETPTVLVLSNQARVPFINDTNSLVSEWVSNAGGVNAAQSMGVENTMPIQPEQIVAADPDYIMLVDVTGKGEESFSSIMESPAVAELSAVSEDHVGLFEGKDVYGFTGRALIGGNESILEWLHPELAQ
ncbi:ABC transporter substrate-binding protein [Corynebacterium casei]|uniref:ABC transporter substrate-binding protein n=1 Tax=Corynebacterium casei TaxID=160386 RepID=UPI003FCF4B62